MKILKVIHGYPPRYMGGSEVYSQTLVHALTKAGHNIEVFTRYENPFEPDFSYRQEFDTKHPEIKLYLVNMARSKDRYQHKEVDGIFKNILTNFQPDIVHIGHLNHLSTSLILEAKEINIPIVFTLHDYWLICPRGQFLQFNIGEKEIWQACDGQDNRKCAKKCYTRYISGGNNSELDIQYWTAWVKKRMEHVKELIDKVDIFIAPARYLKKRFLSSINIPQNKIIYLDYGFNTDYLVNRERKKEEKGIVFGYIGRHVPAKGIHHLIEAFGNISDNAKLKIWGNSSDTKYLKEIAERLPMTKQESIFWMGEYINENIVKEVFNQVDVIVVPSIWVENSPLVIHEAQALKVPVITANIGGMSEYVKHNENGLLFEFRNVQSLADTMQYLVSNPGLIDKLGNTGYLYDKNIPSISEHVTSLEKIYHSILKKPWRITLDTNPDDCNLHCIMCEEHSHFSSKQNKRKESKVFPRRMSLEILQKVFREAKELGIREVIPSTMGEPLLYGHFEEILKLCKDNGMTLNLTTNGTFPKYGAKIWAEKIVPIASDIKVSWNGASKNVQENIMVGSKWEKRWKDIQDFISVRDDIFTKTSYYCRMTLQLTFLESNIDELTKIVEMAIDLNFDRVKGHHLWAHFPEIKDESLRRSKESIQRWNDKVEKIYNITKSKKLSNGKEILLENIYKLDPDKPEELLKGGKCPFLGKEIWINALGDFNPCCAPDEQRKTLGYLGNLNAKSLTEIWNSKEYLHLVENYNDYNLCKTCNMKKE